MSFASRSSKKAVFVVDDEPGVRALIRAAARGIPCEFSEFGEVPAAAAAVRRSPSGLMFLDLELGTSDAVEAFRAFSEAGFRGAIQLMSGSGTEVLDNVKAVGTRYGFELLAPLRKPFRVSQIREILNRFGNAPITFSQPLSGMAQAEHGSKTQFSLELALIEGWLEVWYQPKVDLRTGRTVGAEGLIRARHPDLGLVGPQGFLPGASDYALSQLTEFVLLSSLRDWHSFDAAGHAFQLCINAPACALLNVPIARIVQRNRPTKAYWPGLIVELTEDQALANVELAHEIAAQLRIHKVELALDDFGQGHSTIARLRELPFQSLKIDRSLVSDCDLDPAKRDLCRAVIEIGHQFGCAVVAEGIEREGELEVIRTLGCEYGQGFLLGRPMPKAELIAQLGSAAQPELRDDSRSVEALT